MSWISRVFGFRPFPQNYDAPIGPSDEHEITVLAKLYYSDGTHIEKKMVVKRSALREVAATLLKYRGVTEIRIYQELSHHYKGDDETIIMATALGAALAPRNG